jgi:hypothetical protein
MTKKTYEHPSGVHFDYEVDEDGHIAGTVTISREGHRATMECVFVPVEALQEFARVVKLDEKSRRTL